MFSGKLFTFMPASTVENRNAVVSRLYGNTGETFVRRAGVADRRRRRRSFRTSTPPTTWCTATRRGVTSTATLTATFRSTWTTLCSRLLPANVDPAAKELARERIRVRWPETVVRGDGGPRRDVVRRQRSRLSVPTERDALPELRVNRGRRLADRRYHAIGSRKRLPALSPDAAAAGSVLGRLRGPPRNAGTAPPRPRGGLVHKCEGCTSRNIASRRQEFAFSARSRQGAAPPGASVAVGGRETVSRGAFPSKEAFPAPSANRRRSFSGGRSRWRRRFPRRRETVARQAAQPPFRLAASSGNDTQRRRAGTEFQVPRLRGNGRFPVPGRFPRRRFGKSGRARCKASWSSRSSG